MVRYEHTINLIRDGVLVDCVYETFNIFEWC
jgi:hypothetical protein